jgi:predicted SnoaL-like aldol condensation-catalyzing enzyme
VTAWASRVGSPGMGNVMKTTLIAAAAGLALSPALALEESPEERNKQTAREFYEDLWFSRNTDRYGEYVAETYVVHDVGERKGVTEQAVEQKNIADLFWSFGELDGEIDWQIAEDDMVATRWFISLDPAEGAPVAPVDKVAIINVFRFDDEGKIVEIWNHRHDVELPQPPDMSGE